MPRRLSYINTYVSHAQVCSIFRISQRDFSLCDFASTQLLGNGDLRIRCKHLPKHMNISYKIDRA